MGHALGIDVGNAKVKLCLADLESRQVTWTSRPLPYDARRPHARHADFEAGLPAALAEFTQDRHIETAVCVMTSGYAYPSYQEGALHTVEVLRGALSARTELSAFSIDGRPVPHDQALAEVAYLPFTNGVGAAHLATRLPTMGTPACGLVVDTGGDTSQVNPVVDGEHDPALLADADGPLRHRLRHGKFTWIGCQSTPLEALANSADVAGLSYPVIPRGVRFDNVSSLLGLLPAAVARKLSLFGLHPDRERALAGLAEAVNLDCEMAIESDLVALATFFFERAVERLAARLALARATVPAHCRQRIMCFGLGARLGLAAAERAGFPADTIYAAADQLDPQLAIIASVYGACHKAAELAVGEELPVSLERE